VKPLNLDGFKGKARELLQLKTFGKLACKSLVFVGLGEEKDYELTAARRFAAVAARNVSKGAKSVCLVARKVASKAVVQAMVEGWKWHRPRGIRCRH
jgi:hypothetical protein